MGGYGATTELPEHCRIFVIWLVLRAPTDNVAAAEQALNLSTLQCSSRADATGILVSEVY